MSFDVVTSNSRTELILYNRTDIEAGYRYQSDFEFCMSMGALLAEDFCQIVEEFEKFIYILCGIQFCEGFPQNIVIFPHIVLFIAPFPLFDAVIVSGLAINRPKISPKNAEAGRLPIMARGRIIQYSMSA